MSETKWTPGPWEISSNFTGPLVISPAGKKDDAIAYVFGETFRQAQEDARLISAAPDMAEALADFLENPQFQVGVGGNPIAVEKMLDRARSALAKARGET